MYIISFKMNGAKAEWLYESLKAAIRAAEVLERRYKTEVLVKPYGKAVA